MTVALSCATLTLAAMILMTACAEGHPPTHLTLDDTGDALRAEFRADSGKVRALFLAAPT